VDELRAAVANVSYPAVAEPHAVRVREGDGVGRARCHDGNRRLKGAARPDDAGLVTQILEQLQHFMDTQTWPVILYAFPLALLLVPVGVFVHEVGHVLVARRHGATVKALVVAPEGPSVTVRVAGVPICLGLGLKRDLSSREAVGWVNVTSDPVTARQAIAILAAGPATECVYWTLLVLAGALTPLPALVRIILVVGVFNLANAVAGFFSNREGSDGQRIRRLRTLPADTRLSFGDLRATPAATASTDSVAPPGYTLP
jgi:hypothetical protein